MAIQQQVRKPVLIEYLVLLSFSVSFQWMHILFESEGTARKCVLHEEVTDLGKRQS